MLNRLLLEGQFTDLIDQLGTVLDPNDGVYILYTEGEPATLNKNTFCAVILSLHDDEDDFVPKIALDKNLQEICDVSLIKRIIRRMRKDKPDAKIDDVITAIRYYLMHDTFIMY